MTTKHAQVVDSCTEHWSVIQYMYYLDPLTMHVSRFMKNIIWIFLWAKNWAAVASSYYFVKLSRLLFFLSWSIHIFLLVTPIKLTSSLRITRKESNVVIKLGHQKTDLVHRPRKNQDWTVCRLGTVIPNCRLKLFWASYWLCSELHISFPKMYFFVISGRRPEICCVV